MEKFYSNINSINGISIFIDPNMDGTKFYKGHKQGSDVQFIIAGTEIANILYSMEQKRQRKLKLEQLSKND